ncbi:hypothetical protein HDU76_001338 [Blyttiomyces sp. JEL0837]|nr:hypothetical protein HDU76_001338 [Blyttiomyces sp. JEL0837]
MWTITTLPLLGIIVTGILAYERHPLTNRSRLMFVDEETEIALGKEELERNLVTYKGQILDTNDARHVGLAKIATNIVAVIGADVRPWQLYVVDNPEVRNAFVLPCGAVFVFTGILDVAKNDDMIAAILSHEFGHVISRHSAENLSVQHLFQLFYDSIHSFLYTFSVNLPVLSDLSGRTLDLTAPIIAAHPYSRMLESEADIIGLYLMAAAGYDPQAARRFWERMEELDNQAPPEILSTHPSHKNRAKVLKEREEEAVLIFRARVERGKDENHSSPEQTTSPSASTLIGRFMSIFSTTNASSSGVGIAKQAVQSSPDIKGQLTLVEELSKRDHFWFARDEGKKFILANGASMRLAF